MRYNMRESNEPGKSGQGRNHPYLHEGDFGVGRFYRAKPANEGNGSFPSDPASASNTQTLSESERKRTMSLVNAVNIRESNEPGGDGQGGNCPCLHESDFRVGRIHRAKPANEGNSSFPSNPVYLQPGRESKEVRTGNWHKYHQ